MPALAIANDPDADRLGAAIPSADGWWRRLGGDEIGWLLADHLLANSTPGPHGEDRLVVTTLVSSSLLSKMAADYGVHFAETFTGFKWMARAALDRPHLRLLFAYEQALGYLVTSRPLDKDGISAAVVLAEIAAVAIDEGTTLQGRLDDLAARYGRHVVGERALRVPPAEGAAMVRRLQDDPPATLLDVACRRRARRSPRPDLVRLVLEGGIRLQVRPSGTEPKVKLYGEAVDIEPGPYLDALAARLLGSPDRLAPRGLVARLSRCGWRRPARPCSRDVARSPRPGRTLDLTDHAHCARGPKRSLPLLDGSGAGGRAELAVAGVAEAGDDVGVLVEVVVDGGRDDVHARGRPRAGARCPPARQSTHTTVIGTGALALDQQLDGVHERAAGREHRVDDDDRPPGERLGQLVDVGLRVRTSPRRG